MKERVTKLKLYASVLVKKIVFAWQTETAYAGNTVGELLSTVFYNITFLVFIDVILKKFKLIAGYSFPDMMVLTLISQTVFYAGLPNIHLHLGRTLYKKRSRWLVRYATSETRLRIVSGNDTGHTTIFRRVFFHSPFADIYFLSHSAKRFSSINVWADCGYWWLNYGNSLPALFQIRFCYAGFQK